jgi:adenine-specific DNA methylase
MLPAVAVHAISAYTQPGELVLDPLAGIGTTLVEAVHAGRDAVGIEYEPGWAALARANLEHAAAQGATGAGMVIRGAAPRRSDLLPPVLRGASRWCSPHRRTGAPCTAGWIIAGAR